MTPIETLRQAETYDIIKGLAVSVDYIKLCRQVLEERGIDKKFTEQFLKRWNGRQLKDLTPVI